MPTTAPTEMGVDIQVKHDVVVRVGRDLVPSLAYTVQNWLKTEHTNTTGDTSGVTDVKIMSSLVYHNSVSPGNVL